MVKILIVEDAAFARMRIKKLLERNDFEIFEAENGLLGLETYKKEKPDLCLLDVTMPEMDGMETLKQIITDDKDAKVVMLTNIGQQQTIMECIKLGAKSFIRKPFNEEKLMETVFKILDNKPKEEA